MSKIEEYQITHEILAGANNIFLNKSETSSESIYIGYNTKPSVDANINEIITGNNLEMQISYLLQKKIRLQQLHTFASKKKLQLSVWDWILFQK